MKKIIKIISLIFVFVASLSFVNSATLYQTFQPTFSNEIPSSIYVDGAECSDSSCTAITSNRIELFNGDEFNTCWNNFGEDNDVNKFLTCVNNSKITGNIINTADTSKIVIKEDTDASFGYIKEFFASNDSYLPVYAKSSGYECNYDICVDTQLKNLNFLKKDNAIAEIGQLNIKNIDNDLLPVQVEVPVKIEESVCSAFRFVDSNTYRFYPPQGYSDYSANTLVNLRITNNQNGVEYLNQSITIPIEADQCAGLAAFSWTPDSSLENTEVKFEVKTDVIDNQVSSSIVDWTNDIETIYPEDLNNSCWSKAYDFTLSNVKTFNLNSSIAQISEGESLYTLFKAGAYRDNSITPMDFEAILLFNGTIVYQELEHSSSNLNNYSIDLSSSIKDLSAWNYNVTLLTKPIGYCEFSKSVTQTQNLQILKPDYNNLHFYVKDSKNNNLIGANISLKLINADDYYQDEKTYFNSFLTNSNGYGEFNNLISGTYSYLIYKEGFVSVSNKIHVGSNMDVYITMPTNNSAPVINLPEQMTANYKKIIKLDLTKYITDFNDAFENLVITSKLLKGNVVINKVGNYLELSTNQPNSGLIEVFVQDPSGEISSDIMKVNFINNEAPIINQFYAEPDNGEEPFNTHFYLNVSDKDNDTLTCNIDFGDGTSFNQSCNSLNSIAHTYNLVGSYNPKLSVYDGNNEAVKADEWIYVFNRTIDAPLINDFTISTSNGYIVPTNITLNWDITHPKDLDMNCTLRINSENHDVNCQGSYQINNFNKTGDSKFTIIAIDSNGTQVLRTLERTFYLDKVSLDNLNTELLVNNVIVPGEFNFKIKTNDETLKLREISLVPIIDCDDVENKLDNGNGVLDTKAISSSNSNINDFVFKTNTNDFKLRVPLNRECKFKVELKDEFGTKLTLSKDVVFKYPEIEHKIQSIRGQTTDIVNYMSSALNSNIQKGYNSIEFHLVNNNDSEKEISISLSVQDLNIISSQKINLGPGQERDVQIPLFIKNDVKPNNYPLRFSVYDGENKQIRYSYLRVE